MLKEVEIVDEAGADDGSVSLGSTVTLRYEGDDEDDTQQFFVGSIEERQGDLPVVSPSSPLGPGPDRAQRRATPSSTRRRAACSRSTSRRSTADGARAP